MKAVFIDWHNTLSTSMFWSHHSESRLSPDELRQVDRHVFNTPSTTRGWMTGYMSAEHVCGMAGKHLELDPRDIFHDLKLSCEQMKLYDPSVVEAVLALRERGIKTVIATDNMDTFTRWTVAALKLDSIFDDILNSADVGYQKRYPRFFMAWLVENDIHPSEAVLLDDTDADRLKLPPAMRSELVKHPNQLAKMVAGL